MVDLFRDQQAFSEWPFAVHPLAIAAEPGAPPNLGYFPEAEFVAAFRPDRLVLPERSGELSLADNRVLKRGRPQVHFDAAFGGIVPGDMLESGQITDILSLVGGHRSRRQDGLEDSASPKNIIGNPEGPARREGEQIDTRGFRLMGPDW